MNKIRAYFNNAVDWVQDNPGKAVSLVVIVVVLAVVLF